MAHIGIIGGHGKIAMLAAPLLVEAGHEVTSIIRSSDQVGEVEETGANALVKDVMELSTEQMGELFRDHNFDVLIWSAGAGGGDPERTWKVDRDAAIRSMDGAERAGVKRYLMVSYLGASFDHGVPEDDDFYAYAQSKAEADEHLRGTDLDWTLVGPTALSLDEPTGSISVTTDPQGAKASRGNVARVLVAAIADDGTIRKAYPFADGDTPIAQALRDDTVTDQLA
ncbi:MULTISPECIES: NAD(P)H-binding protein [Micrococcales]|uniref:NAD(P)H-binding protein n=1 Tax=Micrococcales TaxID=85006 RepID=UPI0004AAAA20|nr:MULTISPECIES: NAD(P)H-binding protein [Micrococcales]